MIPSVRKSSPAELSTRHASNQTPIPEASIMVCLHNIRSMHNVGSSFRSCDAMGIHALLLTGYTPTPPRLEISKTALGADEWVKWEHHSDIKKMISDYRNQGWAIVAVEQTNSSVHLQDGIYNPNSQPQIFIFGNEVLGVDDDILELADRVVEIPQYGKKHSFNVSVSLGIVLYAAHQKALARSDFNTSA